MNAIASRSRWLVLCYPNDSSALWAASGLTRRGLMPVDVVAPEALVCSPTLVHTIVEGRSHTMFTLPDGSVIDSALIRGVLNRMTSLPTAHLNGAVPDDSGYALQELHAIVLSVLYGLGEAVINPPTPQGLAGRCRTVVEWLWLAGRAGIRVADHVGGDQRASELAEPSGGTCSVIVFDGRAFGPAIPEDVAASVARFATLAETRLVGVDLVEAGDGTWWFSGASTTPDLRVGGELLLDALATSLDGTSS